MGVDKLLLRKILMLCSALGKMPRLHSQTSPAKNDSQNRFINAVVRFGSTPKHKKYRSQKRERYFLVPVMGVEPTRYRYQRILSPSRLPIPSHRRITFLLYTILFQMQDFYSENRTGTGLSAIISSAVTLQSTAKISTPPSFASRRAFANFGSVAKFAAKLRQPFMAMTKSTQAR